MYKTYAGFVAAFREAAEKLRGGDRLARFPEGSFSAQASIRPRLSPGSWLRSIAGWSLTPKALE